ncbi:MULTISPECIES: P-II family nitrogen regulator [Nitratidesulfovibrio]|uniref:P-II family nitrogen regulator n=1 Tax=Nitratidesulfovibrio TaxID=2802295 RepID=UPI0003F5C6D3|nr:MULTISPECIES: P-II family nitrogen regulator [Nitratidesulfovibrio]NHZ46131.1 P-II family nitrogen regulator [Nitratidesulfovibrio liaohensis]
MKEIMAVVRLNKMNQTKKALTEAGVNGFYAHEAFGRGKGLVSSDLLEGAKEGFEEAVELLGEKGRLYSKRVVTVVVPNDQVSDVVEAIIKVNQTGKPGDGKIFVTAVPEAHRVRTAEHGDKAIL